MHISVMNMRNYTLQYTRILILWFTIKEVDYAFLINK